MNTPRKLFAARREAVSAEDRTARRSRVSVLIVESHDDTRELYADYLTATGFAVATAATTDDALTKAADAMVIVTGISVSGSVNGIGFIQRVRADSMTATTPIIVVTAHTQPSDRERAISAGADAFLPKPCLPARLVKHVRRVLSLARRAAHASRHVH
jgi:two-component system, cell cycle response regulator DivK